MLRIGSTSTTSDYATIDSSRVGSLARKRSTCRVRLPMQPCRGNSLTIPHSAFSKFKGRLVISPNHQIREYRQRLCRRIGKFDLHLHIEDVIKVYRIPKFRTEHLFIIHSDSVEEYFEIIECGVQIWTDEIERSCEFESREALRTTMETMTNLRFERKQKHTDCGSWLFLCFSPILWKTAEALFREDDDRSRWWRGHSIILCELSKTYGLIMGLKAIYV